MSIIKQIQVLPIHIRRMVYSYDPTYRLKYKSVMKELLYNKDPTYYKRRFNHVLYEMKKLLMYEYDLLTIKTPCPLIPNPSEDYMTILYEFHDNKRSLIAREHLERYPPFIIRLNFTTIVKYFKSSVQVYEDTDEESEYSDDSSDSEGDDI